MELLDGGAANLDQVGILDLRNDATQMLNGGNCVYLD